MTVETAHAGRHAWCRRCKRIAIVPAHLTASATVAVEGDAGVSTSPPRVSHSIPEMPGLVPVNPPTAAATTNPKETIPTREDLERLKVKLVESASTIERLNREMARLTTGLSQREKELMQYREYGEKAKRRIAELETELSSRVANDVDRVAKLDRIQSLVNERDLQIQSLHAELAKAQEMAASAERLAQELKTVHGDSASKEQALHEYEEAVESRNAAIEESRRRIDELEDRVRALSGEADEGRAILAAKTEDLERTLVQLEELRTHDSERSAEIEGLEGLLDEREQSIRAVDEECGQIRARVARLEEDLRAQLGAIENKNAALDHITGELSIANDSLAEALDKNVLLEQAIADARLDCERRAEEVARLNAQIEEFQEQLAPGESEALRSEIETLRQQFDEARAENERLRTELAYPEAEPEQEKDSGEPDVEPAGEADGPDGVDDTARDIVRPEEEDDQRMLVDALLRFLGRR